MNTCAAVDKPLTVPWSVVRKVLPEGWRLQAEALGVFRPSRKIQTADQLLQMFLIHLGEGLSVRETIESVRHRDIANVSTVWFNNHFKVSEPWFQWMAYELLRNRTLDFTEFSDEGSQAWILSKRQPIHEPGHTGSYWILQYALDLFSLRCREIHLVKRKGVCSSLWIPSLTRSVLVGSWAVDTFAVLREVTRQKAGLIMGLEPSHLGVLLSKASQEEFQHHVGRTPIGTAGEWELKSSFPQSEAWDGKGRICFWATRPAIPENLSQRSLKSTYFLNPNSHPKQESAFSLRSDSRMVMVFSNLSAVVTPERILETYRRCCMIDSVLKSLPMSHAWGYPKKTDVRSLRSWLLGHIFWTTVSQVILAKGLHRFPADPLS